MAEPDLGDHAAAVAERLAEALPDAKCELSHRNPFELLIATILSAQCTDERVNQVTAKLFAEHPTAAQLAALPLEEIEELVRPTGFFRNKAKSLKACCEALVRDHDGDVPADFQQLVELPGVGRKTANLVLGVAHQIPSGIVVDTHVQRVARRLGLADETNADKTERRLNQLFPRDQWIDVSHRMILHGRRVCKARQPQCERCALAPLCPRIGVGD